MGLSLPAATPADDKIERVPASVLIIDDDPSFRELAERLLTSAGLEVVGHADSARAGMAAAKAIKPDAILLDVILPDGDGVAVAGELAALSWNPRVLLTSSSTDVAAGEEIDNSGAIGFIPKNELPGAPLDRLLAGSER